ncbi:O-antigen ligase family protein [Flavobacterium caeni]|uniref:O-antigen ligase n=1 Tax=Flavobacterium caeni TaxID=490189 RepID=A0A1G5ICK1_9FLAO|nr:O-antigen ligase [Flavobacterium caeni]SCY73491.1 O-antigen ligase [Flavobacterium caeni]
MRANLTVKAYYVFMFTLPLLFVSDIPDKVLLPRQLWLSGFALLLVFLLWKPAGDRFKLHTGHLVLLAFLMLAGCVTLLNTTVMAEGWYMLSKWGLFTAFLLLMGVALQTGKMTARQLSRGALVFGCAALLTALVDMADKTLRGEHLLHWVYTISGGFGNKNLLSSILFLCFPFFCMGLHEGRNIKWISAAALTLSVLLLIILRTRVVLVATLVYAGMAAFFYLKHHYKKGIKLVVGSTLVGIVGLGLAFFAPSAEAQKYVSRLFDTRTLGERQLFWRQSVEMFFEHPLGVGLGNWQVYFPKYGLDQFGSFEIVNGTATLQRPHNDFLWILCETGVLGFAAYVVLFGIALCHAFRSVQSAADDSQRWFSVYVFAGLVGFVLVSFFDFPIERIEHLVLLAILLTLVMYRNTDGQPSPQQRTIPVRVVLYFAVIAGVFSLVVAGQRLVSEKHMFKVYAAQANGDTKEVLYGVRHAEGLFYTIDIKSIPLAWYQGVAEFSTQQFAESQKRFEQAYRLTPYNIHVLNNLASNYEVNGKRKEAMVFYRKALHISPYFEEARLNLAAVYFNDKQYEKAFQTIDSCSTQTRDPKYKIFLPPILKNKANRVIDSLDRARPTAQEINKKQVNDYSSVYYEAKENNTTFERQLITHLKKRQ